MKTLNTLAGCLSLIFLTGCWTDRERHPQVTDIGIQDRIFVQESLAEGAREAQLSRLAITRAQNLDVRLLAQRIYDDQIDAAEELRLIALREGLPTPAAKPVELSSSWTEATGGEFDRMYLRHVVRARDRSIKQFKAATRSADNLDIREFAARKSPILQEQVRLARNIASLAGIGKEIVEPAGAPRSDEVSDPHYRAPGEGHQFNELFKDAPEK